MEPVTPRYNSKSIGCCKKFPGKNAIKGFKNLLHWLNELATEISERLEKDFEENNRRAHLLTVSYMQSVSGEDISSSRSVPLDGYEVEKIARDALECIKRNTDKFNCATVAGNINNPIKFLGLSVGKFEKLPSGRNRIQEMFMKQEVKVKEKIASVVQEKHKKKETPKEGFFSRYLRKMDEKKQAETEKEEEITTIEGELEPESKEEEDAIIIPLSATKENPPAYLTEYAEFHGQTIINLEEFKKVCPKCGIKVLNCDYDSHLDYHVALDLSAQLKMEHKAIHQKSILVNDVAKMQKKKPSATITSGQFLKITEEQTVTTTKPVPQSDITQRDSKVRVTNEEQTVNVGETSEEDPPKNTNSSGNDNELDDLINEMEKDSSVEGLKEENTNLVKQEISTVPIAVPKLKVKDEFKEPSSYKSEYAQFSLQNIDLDDFMKVCPQCNVKVRNYEYDSHLDYHMAMALSQQQRVEHRASLMAVKREAASQSPKTTKGVTKGQKVNSTVTSSSQILKYLIKDPEEEASPQVVEGAEICGECGKAIPLEKVLEHSDLHVAKKLQMELMREERQAVVTKTSSPVVLKKRKGASTQGIAITKFFRGTS